MTSAVLIPPEVTEDSLAMATALAVATANRRAREEGVDIEKSRVSVSRQRSGDDSLIWRIVYGPLDYIGRRGGDLIVEVGEDGSNIHRVMHGQ